MKTTAIIFDFDGTLGDSRELAFIGTRKAFEQFHLEAPSDEEMAFYMGIPIEQSFKEMSDRDWSDDEFEALLTTFRNYYKEYENDYLQIFSGTKEMLEALKGKQLFVLSSKHTEALGRNLASLGIADYFTEVVGSDKVSHYKPHPAGIDYLLEKYQIEADQAVMVGDAIFDLQMGKSAGTHTVAVTWGSHSEEELKKEAPDFVAHTREELAEWLAQ